jgi:hypothetical protein
MRTVVGIISWAEKLPSIVVQSVKLSHLLSYSVLWESPEKNK